MVAAHRDAPEPTHPPGARPADPKFVGGEWAIVGEQSSNTLLVRGGIDPIAIRVSTPDASHLRLLVDEANAGIRAAKGAR
jgi:hypothetical protein